MKHQKQVPIGVKVISVLYYIGAVLGVIFGILLMVGAGAISSIASQNPILAALGTGLLAVAGIIMLALGILGFFIGKGLWNAKSWSRTTAIILSCLGFIVGIFSFDIFGLIIHGVIGGYLLFNNKVKQVFK